MNTQPVSPASSLGFDTPYGEFSIEQIYSVQNSSSEPQPEPTKNIFEDLSVGIEHLIYLFY